MAKRNMKSESESESESKSKSDPSKKKKATKGKRPAAKKKATKKEESFAETFQRDRASLTKALASYEVYEAGMKKRELQKFRERCELLGYSFIPSEEKLVDFFLRSKNSGKEIANCPIEEVDVYANHPKGLIKGCLHIPGKVGYFFTRSPPNEIQSSSDNILGRWIFTKKDDVLIQGKKVGVKQVFEHYEGDHCTGYKILEYQLDPAPIDQKAWFVCKLWDDESCLVVQNQA